MAPRPPSELSLTLAMAVIASSDAPLLLLDSDLTVIAASNSFCRAFQVDPAKAVGRPFAELGAGEWNVPQLSSLLKVTANGYADVKDYEIDLSRKGLEPRRLVMNAHKLDYDDEDNVRLLLAVSDVTDARAADRIKDELLKEKAVLLQELQHRVANSLQIIASVLMQSARRVQSEETRTHLYNAHQRVMSVAAVQKQLAASSIHDVELRPYLTALCGSIGASMIHDPEQLSLEVRSDEAVTNSDTSISLGLIVTELVINALKHAFPNGRSGKIVVDYHSDTSEWTLSVADNGVGMPTGDTKAGLGTNIVQALARQLQAHIKVADTSPGTIISVTHTQTAAVDSGAKVISIAQAI